MSHSTITWCVSFNYHSFIYGLSKILHFYGSPKSPPMYLNIWITILTNQYWIQFHFGVVFRIELSQNSAHKTIGVSPAAPSGPLVGPLLPLWPVTGRHSPVRPSPQPGPPVALYAHSGRYQLAYCWNRPQLYWTASLEATGITYLTIHSSNLPHVFNNPSVSKGGFFTNCVVTIQFTTK